MTPVGRPGYGDYSGPAGEPTPWAAGITVAGLVAALTAVGVFAFGAALTQVHPLFSLAVNAVAAIGIAPTAWRWRHRPVTRWVLAGAGVGVLLGWIGLLAGI
ncbi:DUF2537 domain-containing protein [Nocardia carnea]|uniref:DUF2537 domain-containing protein n=1 Tax=Nocardia carnea TaxID=37328 RepID=UPI002454CBBC|nr:DUF2537 domain-containing protein [Nocardia carnea]